jgi:transposase
MLTLDHFELIRRKHFVDGLSGRSIAAELGHSRKTVAKALRHAEPPGYRRREPASCPVMDRYASIVDAWLEQDRTEPVKQRHTARRVYERLCDEHKFEGSASTVRRYLAKVKARGREVFMPLAFDPGEEAQVDWHEGWIVEGGERRKVQFFCMRLSHSKASFVRAYDRADLVSFLDGHVRAFDYFGGVPRRLAYDNLKSAVVQVRHGRERRLNKRFVALRSCYLFESRFCNVARGNEKGDVENLAKRSERSYLTPVPAVGDLGELNEHLRSWCEGDLALTGPKPHGDRTRGSLFEDERCRLLPLPAQGFEACVQMSTVIDKRSLVTVETNAYSAPVRWAHHPVLIKRFVDRAALWCEQQRVATHVRCRGKGQFVLEPMHYLNLLRTKPGSLDNARPFKAATPGGTASASTADHSYDAPFRERGRGRGPGFRGGPWGEQFDLLRRELEYRYEGQGTKKFINVLLLMTEHDASAVREAVDRCVRRRAFSDEAVAAALREPPPCPAAKRLDLSHRPELTVCPEGIRPAALYDRLCRDEAEVA